VYFSSHLLHCAISESNKKIRPSKEVGILKYENFSMKYYCFCIYFLVSLAAQRKSLPLHKRNSME
jgi:hypothetical protein